MRLSKRLQAIIDVLQPVPVLADIGSDHGKLLLSALRAGKCAEVIATDINPQPLLRAQETLKNEGFEDVSSFYLTDGMLKVDKQAQAWVIAGMGATLINKIIEDSLTAAQEVKQLIVCPHHQPELVRNYLAQQGFDVLHEQLIQEHHYYWILKYQYTGHKKILSLREQYFGLLEPEKLRDYIHFQYKQHSPYIHVNDKSKQMIELIAKEFSTILPQEKLLD